MCGQVGWVGLLVPHCARMIFGSNNRYVIPASISLGAMFMLMIDTMARTLLPSEIPISILTAIIGAPFFIYLLRKTGGGWK
jgi:iron complex transport system permease protein